MKKSLMLAAVAALALAACTPPANTGSEQNVVQAAAGVANVTCESPATAIAIGATVNADITAADAYPANARYYCFEAPAGSGAINISVSGMTSDLDLFVGSNGIASVQGVQLEQGQTYEWMSNLQGTATDSVQINAPRAGIYYVEIVSFTGAASPYTLTVR